MKAGSARVQDKCIHDIAILFSKNLVSMSDMKKDRERCMIFHDKV